MSSFTTDLMVTHLSQAHPFAPGWWRLERDLRYYFIDEETVTYKEVTLLKGFITDGGSFQNWLVPLVGSQTGAYFESYAIHDGLARRPDLISWDKANGVLDESLEVQGMPPRKRRRVRWGLMLGSPSKKPEILKNAEEFVVMKTDTIFKIDVERIVK